jgi:hypothetical protein
MNIDFIRINLIGSKNSEGTTVQSAGRESMIYERKGFKTVFEVYVKDDVIVVYQPNILTNSLPQDLSEQDLYAEIRAGVSAATARKIEWKVG